MSKLGRGGSEFRIIENRIPQFERRLQHAAMEALAESAHEGSDYAREQMRHARTGKSRASIGWRVRGHFMEIFVGTLGGRLIETGTSRAEHGRVNADPYLKPGMKVALHGVLPKIKARMFRIHL